MDGMSPYLAYVIALGIAAAIPGPGIAALVGHALGTGFRASLFFLCGIALGDVVYLTVAVAGLAALAQAFAPALIAVKVLGGLYLVYMAFGFWRNRAGLGAVERVRDTSSFASFTGGFLVTLGNPKTIVFYLALLPSVLNLGAVGLQQWAVLTALTGAVLLTVLLPYAALASNARHWLSQGRAVQILNRSAAAIIGSAGVVILGEAAQAALRRA